MDPQSGFAYCWGANSHGDLGDGSLTTRWEPVLVANGSVRFSSVSASGAVTCGVDALKRAAIAGARVV